MPASPRKLNASLTSIAPLDAIPVLYDERMVAMQESYSPSAGKPRAVLAAWQASSVPIHLCAPIPVSRAALLRAHEGEYVDGILAGLISNGFGNTNPAVTASLPWTSGAMLSAARAAVANGQVAAAPCSGFHHAGHANGGGYCTFNGLMVAALALVAEDKLIRVGILDCDQHYGDGTVDIINTLALMAQVRHVTAGKSWHRPAQAKAFLAALPDIVDSFADCDVLLYQAGADPHIDDPLGGWLTTDQLAQRDLAVFTAARQLGLPVAWNLAGGYQQPVSKVIAIHDNTMAACWAVYGA